VLTIIISVIASTSSTSTSSLASSHHHHQHHHNERHRIINIINIINSISLISEFILHTIRNAQTPRETLSKHVTIRTDHIKPLLATSFACCSGFLQSHKTINQSENAN
jgi:hypothetical protein